MLLVAFHGAELGFPLLLLTEGTGQLLALSLSLARLRRAPEFHAPNLSPAPLESHRGKDLTHLPVFFGSNRMSAEAVVSDGDAELGSLLGKALLSIETDG